MEHNVEIIESPDGIRVESAVVFSYPAHIHTYSEMILYEPFDGTVIVNDLHIPADSGCAVLIVPSDLHRIVVRESRGARFLKIAFASKWVEASVLMKNPGEEKLLSAVFEEIGKSGSDEAFLRLLVQTAEQIMLKKGEKIGAIRKSAQRGLAVEAVHFVKAHAQEPITLQSAAEALFVSPSYLSKVFKETIGIGFAAFLGGVRLDKAAELLYKTQKSITEVCMESGFNNLSHFIRSFKRRFGCSPAAFRRESAASHPNEHDASK